MNKKKIVTKVVLAGVVVNNGKVLILQRHKNEDVFPELWELPSGKKEPLETSENSLRREIKEETGLRVEIIKPISVFDYQIEKETEIKDSTQINFLVMPKGDIKVKISQEHQAFTWITEKELDNYEISDQTKEVIAKTFQILEWMEK